MKSHMMLSRPVHPGEILREMVLPALDMPVTAVAESLGVTRQQLHRVLSEEAAVSPEMALRLGRLLGNGEGLWLRMQGEFDLWRARQRLSGDLEKITPIQFEEIS